MAGTVDKSNSAELGLANGTTISVANTGGGSGNTAFGAINIGAGCTATVTSSSPLDGTFSFSFSQSAAGILEIYWALPSLQNDASFQCEFVYATPAVNLSWLRSFTTTTFTGTACTVISRTDNKWHIFDTTSSTQSITSTGTLTPGSTYVAQFRQVAGTVTMYIYPKGSTTRAVEVTMASGDVNVGSFRFGIPTASAIVTYKMDNVKIGHGGFLPRTDVSNSPPTASAGPTQYVVVGSTVALVGTDSDADGTITARAWTWDTTDTSGPAGTTRKWGSGPSITGSTTRNGSAVMATAGAFRAKYVVTDDLSADSTPAYTEVFVSPASGGAVAVRHGIRGSWTRTGGSDNTAVMNDADDATGWTVTSPSATVATFLMQPHGPATSALTFTVRGNSSGGNISRLCEWYKPDGTTLIDSDAGSPSTAPTSIGNQVFTMDPTPRNALTQAELAELVVLIKSTG